MRQQRFAAIPLLIAILILSACGGGFASQLRLILSASGPLIDSLNLGDKRGAVITDFADLAGGAANLGDDLKACGASKPCKLDAVSRFESVFEKVDARGHFGMHPKLQTVEGIIKGIIASARIYYGGSAPSAGNAPSRVVTEQDLKAQLEELKAALRP